MTSLQAIEVGVGKSKSQHGLVLSAMLMVCGVASAFLTEESVPGRGWIGALLIALGLGVAVFAWRRGHDTTAHLRIDEAGVWYRDWEVTVPWPEIERVLGTGSRMQPYIALKLRDPARFLAGLEPEPARRLRGNRLWKAPEIRIPNGALAMPYQELLSALRDALEAQSEMQSENQSGGRS